MIKQYKKMTVSEFIKDVLPLVGNDRKGFLDQLLAYAEEHKDYILIFNDDEIRITPEEVVLFFRPPREIAAKLIPAITKKAAVVAIPVKVKPVVKAKPKKAAPQPKKRGRK